MLKETAKALNFLQEHGQMQYAELENVCDAAVQRCTKSLTFVLLSLKSFICRLKIIEQ